MQRNRSQGWKHAKMSGHENEISISSRMNIDPCLMSRMAERLDLGGVHGGTATVGGLRESSVDSVLGGKTKAKTDLVLHWGDSRESNISIKKKDSFLLKHLEYSKDH